MAGTRAGQGDQAGTDAAGRPRRQPRGARHHLAAGDQQVATAVFVIREPRPGKAVEPECRRVFDQRGTDLIQDGGGDADVGDHDLAGQCAAGQQQMGWLAAKEGDGGGRLRGDAQHLTSVALDAARQIDGETGQAAGVHGFDYSPRRTLERARQAGTEEGIDR